MGNIQKPSGACVVCTQDCLSEIRSCVQTLGTQQNFLKPSPVVTNCLPLYGVEQLAVEAALGICCRWFDPHLAAINATYSNLEGCWPCESCNLISHHLPSGWKQIVPIIFKTCFVDCPMNCWLWNVKRVWHCPVWGCTCQPINKKTELFNFIKYDLLQYNKPNILNILGIILSSIKYKRSYNLFNHFLCKVT